MEPEEKLRIRICSMQPGQHVSQYRVRLQKERCPTRLVPTAGFLTSRQCCADDDKIQVEVCVRVLGWGAKAFYGVLGVDGFGLRISGFRV